MNFHVRDFSPEADDASIDPLFGHFPPYLFNLLSGKLRYYYADLLLFLHEEVLADTTRMVHKAACVDAIRIFIDTRYPDIDPTPRNVPGQVNSADMRPTQTYSRLLETGWLVEYRDRHRQVIELHENARVLLDLILDIRAGKTRSYGGEVLQVLTLLQGAKSDPTDRSELIRNAAKSSKSFLRHLRTMSSMLRRIEEEILSQKTLTTLFGVFFDSFVQQHLISDYANLKTNTNPFRFRTQIIELCYDLIADDLLIDLLAEGYLREGRAKEIDQARSDVLSEIESIQRVFDNISSYLEVVEQSSARLERRVHNTIMNMDRFDAASTARVASAIRAIRDSQAPPDAEIQVPSGALDLTGVAGPRSLFNRREPERSSSRRALVRPERNEQYEAMRRLLAEYRAKANVTPADVAAFLDRVMGDRDFIEAIDIPVNDLETFFIYERMRIVLRANMDGINERFLIRQLGGVCDNEWLATENFLVERAGATR